MLGICLGTLTFALDAGIVNIALPVLVQVFDTSLANIQLVAVSYLLVLCALALGAGRLGDMFGKKRLYLTGLFIFTLSSLLCSLASSAAALIAFRILQGLGAAFLSALGAAIVTEIFPDSQRGQALGIIGAVLSVGIATGPSVGGLLLASLGWRSIFWTNIPMGILSACIVYWVVPQSVCTQSDQRFDWRGTGLAIALLAAFILGMTQGQGKGFSSPITLGLLAAAIAGLIYFIKLESRIKQPMLDMSIFRNAAFSASLLAAILVFIVIAGTIFLLPFCLEFVLNYSAEETSWRLGIAPVTSAVVAPFAGRLADRVGARPISLVGLSFLLGGALAISTLSPESTHWGYISRVIPFGVGMGLFQSPNNSIILGGVPKKRLGIASSLLSLSRTLGQATGIPIMGTVFTGLIAAQNPAMLKDGLASLPPQSIIVGLKGGCYVAVVLIVIAIAIMTLASRSKRRPLTHP